MKNKRTISSDRDLIIVNVNLFCHSCKHNSLFATSQKEDLFYRNFQKDNMPISSLFLDYNKDVYKTVNIPDYKYTV